MAQAEVISHTVTKTIVDGVTLNLSEAEARTLLAIFGRIGGSMGSPRKHCSAMHTALSDALDRCFSEVPEYELLNDAGSYRSSIHFKDYDESE